MKDTEKINSWFIILLQESLRIKCFQIIWNSYFLLWFDLFIIQVHKNDKIQLQNMREKQQKTKLTRDSEVPGGFPWSELNHFHVWPKLKLHKSCQLVTLKLPIGNISVKNNKLTSKTSQILIKVPNWHLKICQMESVQCVKPSKISARQQDRLLINLPVLCRSYLPRFDLEIVGLN